MSLNDTPSASRLHIMLVGKRNSGKSSLLNALVGQQTAIVSAQPGTTTDPVGKPIEIHGLGPCVITDTAGVDDAGSVGELRVEKTLQALRKADAVILVVDHADTLFIKEWQQRLKGKQIVVALNKGDLMSDADRQAKAIYATTALPTVVTSAINEKGIDSLRQTLIHLSPKSDEPLITQGWAESGDLVMLIMPQDREAPKGRLILPQQQTIRELLEKHCAIVACQPDEMTHTLKQLNRQPDLIITDTQALRKVKPLAPKESKLTTFSILFAARKGDIHYFMESAKVIDKLTESSRVLIAEACSHAPVGEDIGRVKIPRLLRKKTGEKLTIDMVAGSDFPDDLRPYDLIIHCGACMFNRTQMMARVEQAKSQQVPMTNYGVAVTHILNSE
ncbi:MAG: [FeFe] hydrogenase H-cluster maturation GTPase HydF [Prevotella sp.]|jgi:[FeFe] hydrogenase H-cluster maturation GTPase HydF